MSLFVRLWAVSCVVGVLTLAAYDVTWTYLGEEDEDRWFDDTVGPMMERLGADVMKQPDVHVALQQLEVDLGYEVSLVDRGTLPEEVVWSWDTGYRAGYTYHDDGDLMYTVVDAERALVWGPLPDWSWGPNRIHLLVIVGFSSVMAGVLALVMWPLHRSQRALQQAARAVAAGDLQARVAEAESATPQVAAAFNHMAERTRFRLEAQRDLLRAVSHELRTPLSRLQLGLDLLLAADAEGRVRHGEGVQTDLAELNALIEELTAFVRWTEAVEHREWVLLGPLVSEAVGREAPGAVLELAAVRARVSPSRFVRAVRNLVRNAVVHGGSEVWVTLTEEGAVLVQDNGEGIDEADVLRVLEPFVRRRSSSDGMGLGLAIVDRIVADHDGTLTIEASAHGGACVVTTWGPTQA
ncbi:MAG: HAMP domain-containing histidine kinase [Myxococcales bacterium]|nr:HAMP domain-containing histidine kinase [Myxococcales bacterium]